MRLLLDQGLPRSTVPHLRDKGIEATHVGDKGLATAADSKILDYGRREGFVVVTLDAVRSEIRLRLVSPPTGLLSRLHNFPGLPHPG